MTNGIGDNQVDKLMTDARTAAGEWGKTSVENRADRIGELRRELMDSRSSLVQCICRETGKTRAEALISDVLPTLEILQYLENSIVDTLSAVRRKTPFIYRSSHSRVEYHPRGVVLIIGPWNNPLQLCLVPAASALAAGNAVILKPSERTPETARLIGGLVARTGIDGAAFQVAPGAGNVAQRLVEAQPDMIFFTGGADNGRSVLRAAAEHIIPVVLELGGKDPMIVFADADIDRAVHAAMYGAYAHAGQHCVSTKRLYVETTIYDEFLRRLTDQNESFTDSPEWGHVVDEKALARAKDQIHEALAAGARLLFPDRSERAGVEPTLLADVDQSLDLMQEETFAPVLAAHRFDGADEAVELANDSPYGLNASIWSDDVDLCNRIASQLVTGNVVANNVLTNIGNPHLPFGGVNDSGIGRYHGPEGVRCFCRTTSVMISENSAEREPNWFPHDDDRVGMVEELINLRHGDQGLLERIKGWAKLIWKMR